MNIEGQGHFLTLFFQVLYVLCLYMAQISGERLQDHWSSGFIFTFLAKKILFYAIRFSNMPKAVCLTMGSYESTLFHCIIKSHKVFWKNSSWCTL